MHQPLGGAVLVRQAQAAAPRTIGGQGYGGDPAGGSWDPLKSHIHVTEPQRNSATLGSSRPRNTPEERWRIAFKKFDQDDSFIQKNGVSSFILIGLGLVFILGLVLYFIVDFILS